MYLYNMFLKSGLAEEWVGEVAGSLMQSEGTCK